uniref:Uncharacterized protein n=1 Tax=Plectus sambesii TaxID=2011161 RepID=A0A914UJ76_9BILA
MPRVQTGRRWRCETARSPSAVAAVGHRAVIGRTVQRRSQGAASYCVYICRAISRLCAHTRAMAHSLADGGDASHVMAKGKKRPGELLVWRREVAVIDGERLGGQRGLPSRGLMD